MKLEEILDALGELDDVELNTIIFYAETLLHERECEKQLQGDERLLQYD